MRTLLTLLAATLPLLASPQTKFFKGTYAEAFAEAEKQGKYLFIDCVTDWCTWCKAADREMFPAPAISDFLNRDFISVKVDMERGDGIYLGQKYRVAGYPAYLIFTPEGYLAQRISGYYDDHGKFIKEAAVAMVREGRLRYPSKLTDKVEFPDFYLKSFTDRDKEEKRTMPDQATVIAWLSTQADLMGEAAWSVMSRFQLDDKFNTHVLSNREALAAMYGKNEVDNKVAAMAQQLLNIAMRSKDEKDLQAAIDFADRHFDQYKEENKAAYRLRFCEGKGDWVGYADCAQRMIDMYGLEANPQQVNAYAWTIYEQADNTEVLGTAAGWMKQVVAIDPNFFFTDTYAALLHKLGRNKEALDWVNKAIAAGKAEEHDVSESEELKKKIESALGH